MCIHNWKDFCYQMKVVQLMNINFQDVKLCYVSLKIYKMPKLALANGLWIGITLKILSRLTMVEETLIIRYHYCTILVKLRYTNKGSTTCQHAFKGNVVNFAQDPKNVIKVLNTLSLSLEPLSNIIVIHFV
jgi:hypothetical protein